MSEARQAQRGPTQRPERRCGLLLYLIAAVGLLVCSLAGGVLYAIPGINETTALLLYDVLYYGLFALLPIALCILRRRELAEALRPNPLPLLATISIVSIALISVFLVNDLSVLWAIPFQRLGFQVNAGAMAVPRDTAGMMLSVISVAALPGICEELLFRGMILSAFERNGTKHAALVSALLFAGIHGSLIGAPGMFLLGLVLALLVVYTDSIYAGMIFHTTYNAAVLILQFLQERYETVPPVEDYFTAVGGFSGIIGLLFSCGFSALLIWQMLRMLRFRGRILGVSIVERNPERLRAGEKLLLMGGIAVCILLYGLDIFQMLM